MHPRALAVVASDSDGYSEYDSDDDCTTGIHHLVPTHAEDLVHDVMTSWSMLIEVQAIRLWHFCSRHMQTRSLRWHLLDICIYTGISNVCP